MNPTLEQLRAGLTRAQEAGDTEAAEIIQGRIQKNPQALYEGYERAGQAGDLEAAREIRKRHLTGFQPKSDDDLATDPFWNKEAKTLYKAFNFEGTTPGEDPAPEVAHKWALDFMSKQNWGEVTPGHTLWKFATEEVDPEVAAAFLNASDAYNATPVSWENTKRAVNNALNPSQSPSVSLMGVGKLAGKLGTKTMSKALRSKLEKRIADASLRGAVAKDLVEKGVTTTGARVLAKGAGTGAAYGAGHMGVMETTAQNALVDAGEQESVDWSAVAGSTSRGAGAGALVGSALASPAALRARRNYKGGTKVTDQFEAQRDLDSTTRLQQAAVEHGGTPGAARDMTDITAKIRGGTGTSEDVIQASRLAADAGKGQGGRWSAEVGSAAAKSVEEDLKVAHATIQQGLQRGEITSADAAEITAVFNTAKNAKGTARVATLKDILPRTSGDTQKAVESLIGTVEPASALQKTRNVYQQGSKVGEFLDQPGVQVAADTLHIPGLGPLGNLSLVRRALKAADPMFAKRFPAGKNVKNQLVARAKADDLAAKYKLGHTQDAMAAQDVAALGDVAAQHGRVKQLHEGMDAQIAARNAPPPPAPPPHAPPKTPRESLAERKARELDEVVQVARKRFRMDAAKNPKAVQKTRHGGIQAEWAQRLGMDRNAVIEGLRIIEKGHRSSARTAKTTADAADWAARADQTKQFREAYAVNLNTEKMAGLGGKDAFYAIQDELAALAQEGVARRSSAAAQNNFARFAQTKPAGGPTGPIPQVMQLKNRVSGEHGPSGAALRKWQRTKEQSRTIKTPVRDVAGERAQAEFLAQMNWLNEQAKVAGYADLDELGAKDPDLLGRLSAEWREAQNNQAPEQVKQVVTPVEKAQRRAKAKRKPANEPLPEGPPPMPTGGTLTPVEVSMPKAATPLPPKPTPARPAPKAAVKPAIPEAPKEAPKPSSWQPKGKALPMSAEARAAIVRAQAKVGTSPLAGKSKDELKEMLKILEAKAELSLEEARLMNQIKAALKS